MRKKILFILNSLAMGGAEKQTIALVNSLDKNIFETGLVYLDNESSLLPQVDASQLTVLKCLYRKHRLDLRVVKNLRQLIHAHRYDAVVCVDSYPMLYAFICRLTGRHRPAIVQVLHSTIPRPDEWTRIKNIYLYRHLMNRCQKMIFVCKRQMHYWIEKFSIQPAVSTYIYNGIDTAYFSDTFSAEEKLRLRQSLGFHANDFIAGICAALRPEKKHTDFIDAIKLARTRNPDVKGLVIGDGPLKNDIQRYIRTNGMDTSVKMAGLQRDVRPYIAVCDCMTLTSHEVETFSMAALEAMAMARPMVMTDLGGAREQVEHGVSGFVYEKGDITTLAGLLCDLAENQSHGTMGANARARVCGNFTLEQMVEAYTGLLKEIA